MGVMSGQLGLVVFIMFGGHAMMMGSLFMMLGGGMMMGAGWMLVRHGKLPLAEAEAHRNRAKEKCQAALTFANPKREASHQR